MGEPRKSRWTAHAGWWTDGACRQAECQLPSPTGRGAGVEGCVPTSDFWPGTILSRFGTVFDPVSSAAWFGVTGARCCRERVCRAGSNITVAEGTADRDTGPVTGWEVLNSSSPPSKHHPRLPGAGAFCSIIPCCKHLSTQSCYSCRVVCRKFFRRNSLRRGKLFGCRPSILAPKPKASPQVLSGKRLWIPGGRIVYSDLSPHPLARFPGKAARKLLLIISPRPQKYWPMRLENRVHSYTLHKRSLFPGQERFMPVLGGNIR